MPQVLLHIIFDQKIYVNLPIKHVELSFLCTKLQLCPCLCVSITITLNPYKWSVKLITGTIKRLNYMMAKSSMIKQCQALK